MSDPSGITSQINAAAAVNLATMQAAMVAAGYVTAPQAAVAARGAVYTQVGFGPYRDGATAAGNPVSLLGSGVGTLAISCDRVGATWRISGGGIFSTTGVTPGNVTPQISFGSMSTSYAITNILAAATDQSWRGSITVVCGTIGTGGTMYVPIGVVNYASGTLLEGAAPLNKSTALTGDNTGSMAVDIKVTMAGQNAANKFRLDGMTIERLY